MPNVIYTLECTTDSFFSDIGAPSLRLQCDQFAEQRYGGRVQPVHIQGMTSYTVVAGPSGDRIIQFREQIALLDMNILALVKDIHKDFVPSCAKLGSIGELESSQLVICDMDRVTGESSIIARSSLTYIQLESTVNSLAKFFAQSWQSGTPRASTLAKRSDIEAEYVTIFKYLADDLPQRFQQTVTEVQTALPMLLDRRYPLIPTHGDLNEMNILVDMESGEITGIVDWAEASFQAFGFTLYALENVLGSMGPAGWQWHDNANNLRKYFWNAFRGQTGVCEDQLHLIKLAGKAGSLIRYGTSYKSGLSGMLGVRDSNSADFNYLDALLGSRNIPICDRTEPATGT